MKTNKSGSDVIYPCRIPREVFQQVQDLADARDLSASQVIRAALKQMVRVDENAARLAKKRDNGFRRSPEK